MEEAAIQLSVDRPAEDERLLVHDRIVVEGWAWSPDGPPEVSVTVADRAADVAPGTWRPDVSAALGIAEHQGFVAVVPITGLPPGPIEVVVTATMAGGASLQRRRTVEIAGLDSANPERPRPWAGLTERLEPRMAPGGLTHVEHVTRYRWVAPLAAGRDVLDAACGVGYGARVLGDAGARSVVGVDAFAAAIIEAREQARGDIEFGIGDLRDLPFAAGRFDLVVCFEAIEHIVEQELVVSELKRVLRPGGILAMSTPLPNAIAVRNPHHVGELEPRQLEQLLAGQFANVRVCWQHSALASLVGVAAPGAVPAPRTPPLGWTAGPIEPMYAVALAGDDELPSVGACGSLAAGFDIGGLITQVYELSDRLDEARAQLAAEEARAGRAESAQAAQAAREQATAAALAVAVADATTMRSSRSWAITAPARGAARVWRGRGGR